MAARRLGPTSLISQSDLSARGICQHRVGRGGSRTRAPLTLPPARRRRVSEAGAAIGAAVWPCSPPAAAAGRPGRARRPSISPRPQRRDRWQRGRDTPADQGTLEFGMTDEEFATRVEAVRRRSPCMTKAGFEYIPATSRRSSSPSKRYERTRHDPGGVQEAVGLGVTTRFDNQVKEIELGRERATWRASPRPIRRRRADAG